MFFCLNYSGPLEMNLLMQQAGPYLLVGRDAHGYIQYLYKIKFTINCVQTNKLNVFLFFLNLPTNHPLTMYV